MVGGPEMITFRISADVKDDRLVVLTLPPEVPTGTHNFTVTVAEEAENAASAIRSSLADWADENAEHWGDRLRATDVEDFTGRGA